MAEDRQIGDADLTSMTGGDEARARALRKTLQKLAESDKAGPTLQEMAREILSGRVGLREAMRVGAYADALGEKLAEGRRAYEAIPREERERQMEAARDYLAEQRAEIDRERAEAAQRRGQKHNR
ncbi:hypothetical protein QIS99_27180 [Streptomyces sp. B-S-A8]|uniref:Uncharacterized protein n=1 Tax=Streptomyces solicavernae TaxID=3043614 RepID=A0ABT6S1S8_9ACTN|nr:hypothetical protein [Streptomyces sp. B-S-A8]MDI3389846.1 hypothetical protein [Streptomyces sp. B-S-A8]